MDALDGLSEQSNHKSLESQSRGNFLAHWSVEKAEEGVIFLRHPAVRREIILNNNIQQTRKMQEPTANDLREEEEEEDLLCDDTVLQDDPEVSLGSLSQDNQDSTMATEWHFSIIYSDTWKAPVLYFTVQNICQNGSPLHRSEVVDLLSQYSPHNSMEDSWDFLSHEEHPIFRHPSFFLHPCQTMERLSSLVLTENSSERDESDQCLLLSWMSLILPSVGCAIPSHTYKQLEELLCK